MHRQWQKTDIRTGVKWSSKHSPNIKSFISAMCFLGEVPSLRRSHLASFCTYWNHTQHVKDVLPSGAGLQFPWFLRFRGGISPMHPRDQAIGGIVDFLRLAGDWFRINDQLMISLSNMIILDQIQLPVQNDPMTPTLVHLQAFALVQLQSHGQLRISWESGRCEMTRLPRDLVQELAASGVVFLGQDVPVGRERSRSQSIV